MFITSCCIINNKQTNTNEQNQEQQQQNKDQNTDDDSSNDSLVTIINNSDFTVNLYSNPARTNLKGTILSGDASNISFKPSFEETVFYITYRINIGVEIPWDDNDSYIVVTTENDKPLSANIENPASIKTKDAFILLENNSNTSIILKSGASTEAFPLEKNTSILNKDEFGVYQISSFNFDGFSTYTLTTVQGKQIPLPNNFVRLESGNIYTISIFQNSIGTITTNLESISPFDIDTQRQIWSLTDNTFSPDYPCILRNSVTNDGSNLIMGTMANNPTNIGYKVIDKYNSESKSYSFQIKHEEDPLLSTSVLDFAQIKDRSIIMLLENIYRDEINNENYSIQFISCFDFDKQELKNWTFKFPEQMIFRANSKNKFIYTKDGKVAIAGALKRDNQIHRYFAILDISSEQPTLSSYTSPDFTDLSNNIETMFTSIWYDGTDFFVCGYDNWDFNYTELSHKGIIYKFNPLDLTDNQEIYSCDRVLFFCIDGTEKNWYACGEYADTGKMLKGCYISKTMADDGKDPVKHVTYSTNRSYCYFTQLCCYQNKIVVAGKASNSFDETKDPLPVIVAFDKTSDEILWENTSFTKYTDVNAIIPNLIGTYVVQLQSNSYFHYVSADLLGNEKK